MLGNHLVPVTAVDIRGPAAQGRRLAAIDIIAVRPSVRAEWMREVLKAYLRQHRLAHVAVEAALTKFSATELKSTFSVASRSRLRFWQNSRLLKLISLTMRRKECRCLERQLAVSVQNGRSVKHPIQSCEKPVALSLAANPRKLLPRTPTQSSSRLRPRTLPLSQ
jgi:hypothetical protein